MLSPIIYSLYCTNVNHNVRTLNCPIFTTVRLFWLFHSCLLACLLACSAMSDHVHMIINNSIAHCALFLISIKKASHLQQTTSSYRTLLFLLCILTQEVSWSVRQHTVTNQSITQNTENDKENENIPQMTFYGKNSTYDISRNDSRGRLFL